MKQGKSIMIADYEEKISYLENRIENILRVIEKVNTGEVALAKKLLDHNEIYDYRLLAKLIEKSSCINPFRENKDEDKTYSLLKIIIESMPFPVFIKDETGTYILINSLEADLFGLTEAEIIGMHDSDFVKNPEEMEIIRKSDEEVLFNNKTIELPNQKFSLPNGRSYVFQTHKIPFVNPITGSQNILGFSIDVSDTINLSRLQRILMISNNPYL